MFLMEANNTDLNGVTPKIGLVTVLFNSDNQLEGFLRSLSIQTFKNYHVYFIDNTPSVATDTCLSLLMEHFPIPAYSHFKSDGNIGIAKGNNLGIKEALLAGCEYVLLLNNDIEFDQTNLLESIVFAADIGNEAFVVPKIYFYDTHKLWMAGGHFEWWKAMAYHIGEYQDDGPRYNKERYCNFAPACFLLVRSTVFQEIGLIDENYFVYFEDTDFIYRSVEKGLKILYCPDISILHKVGSSTGGYDSIFSIYYGNRNRIYFIRKHYNPIKKIVTYLFVLGTRVLKYLKYDKEQKKELLRGIRDGFTMNLN